MSLTKSSGWQWRENKIEEQNWRMMQLPNGSGWPWRRTKKEEQKGMDLILDLISKIHLFFSSRNELARP